MVNYITSEAQEVRSDTGWDLFPDGTCWDFFLFFFQFECKTTLGTWSGQKVPGNDIFCHNDGSLFHISIYGG